jgi:hypothetical protein
VYFHLARLDRGVLAKKSPHCAKSNKNLAQITDRKFQDLATIKPLVSTHGGDMAFRIIPNQCSGMKCQVHVSFQTSAERFDHHAVFDLRSADSAARVHQ